MSAIVAAHGPFDEQLGERMLERMAHRGPDGAESRRVGEGWLGTRYLSSTDPRTGAQPLGRSRQAIWLVGDGEIYSHRQIRRQLGEARFSTGSDLEPAAQLAV